MTYRSYRTYRSYKTYGRALRLPSLGDRQRVGELRSGMGLGVGFPLGSPPLGRGGGGYNVPSTEKNIGKGVLFANKCVNLLSLQILITKWKS